MLQFYRRNEIIIIRLYFNQTRNKKISEPRVSESGTRQERLFKSIYAAPFLDILNCFQDTRICPEIRQN